MCGLAGIISIKNNESPDDKIDDKIDVNFFENIIDIIEKHQFSSCHKDAMNFSKCYLGGKDSIDEIDKRIRLLKKDNNFVNIFNKNDIQDALTILNNRLCNIIETEEKQLSGHMGRLCASDVEIMSQRIEAIRDLSWCLKVEILDNLIKINELLGIGESEASSGRVKIFKKINSVLNSVDRLEVRGRDSAGISLMFILNASDFGKFKDILTEIKLDNSNNLLDQFNKRSKQDVLLNLGINIRESKDDIGNSVVAVGFVYKIAAEIGSLGDNTRFLRHQIKNDQILHKITQFQTLYYTISSHTRWASVGIITEANCHPVDNRCANLSEKGIIHVCLNGDIDNYLELKEEYEKDGHIIHKDITTDTKIIPLQIEKYIKKGLDVKEAFRLAVNDFEGSHAISMHTDLAPGQFFLAQKGSGQAIFIGIAEDHYMPTSEVYGFIEETPYYIKMDGEKANDANIKGQIFILNQSSKGGLDGISAMFYDGAPVLLSEKNIKSTIITSRDIDRQNFPHYFLKEVSESPSSVEKTLLNRWKIKDSEKELYGIVLDEKSVPHKIKDALISNKIRRIFFIGQGTAGIAAISCADIMNYYLNDPKIYTRALKSSEMSGFMIGDSNNSMDDSLVIAITQSGTTTDTNRAVDMVKEKGAYTLAIVNRRDSDITFRVDGVMYTSSGRDIEMSVASTKAFYSQIVAGALLGLFIAHVKRSRNDEFVTQETKKLLEIPDHMRKVLSLRAEIEKSAKRLAPSRIYWAVVGSGPNKASSDEIRIKLSELCYKTISSDYVEDKKHIDLSSEPLIIVCAAGSRATVIGDIIKDTAIFKAHKAAPVVIADEGERRFDSYAEDVFNVPVVSEHLAPILNTLVGHIWGYYAALTINEGSKFFFLFRENIQTTIDEYIKNGNDLYELVLESSFREKIALFYYEFAKLKAQNRFPAIIGVDTVSNLTLLLKYLSGRLPVTDFELDFGVKGTAFNMINALLKYLSEAIDRLARPIDAIKHQAKTVTVGTSRISEKFEGLLYDKLLSLDFKISQLTPNNILVLKNLQNIIAEINGSILYKIAGLNLLGELTDKTTIEVVKKDGILLNIPSRVEKDNRLKGTKRIIIRQGNAYVGKGRSDDRSILIIPLISASASMPNIIEYLLLFNVSFKNNIPLPLKIRALGGKYEHIKNIVQENSFIWQDEYIEIVDIQELFGKSAEKIGECISSKLRGC